jgi:5-methylthioadenosine/S-adenosylhomocysteine deaminase
MMVNGITTFADMWHTIGSAAQAVECSGLRAVLAYNIKDFGDLERGDKELEAALQAIQTWNGYANGRVTVVLGPHSVYLCQPQLLEACGQEARKRDLQIQIHVSENQREVDECRREYKTRSPVQLLAELGLLGENTLASHVVCVDNADIRLLRQSNTAVAHNIISNLKLASGIAPVPQFIKEGLRIGLGTDGPGSNDSLDLLRDLKTAVLVQKGVARDAGILSARQALRMATLGGAEALGMSDKIGSLEEGKKADLILIDMDKPHLTPHHYDYFDSIYSLLLFSATGADVDYVVVDGTIVLDRGRAVMLDPDEVKREAQERSRRLLKDADLI